MGKTIIAENEIEESVLKFIDKKSFQFGLIVGKVREMTMFVRAIL